jgi:methionyl-tRNA formyltransferase
MDDDLVWDMLGRMSAAMPGILTEALVRLAAGDEGAPQDQSMATDAPHFEPNWRFIDWSEPARQVHNKVRSWTGMRGVAHGAIGEVGGQMMVIKRTRLLDPEAGAGSAKPGTVVNRSNGQLTVHCGDGPLAIVDWESVPGVEPAD